MPAVENLMQTPSLNFDLPPLQTIYPWKRRRARLLALVYFCRALFAGTPRARIRMGERMGGASGDSREGET